MTTIHERWAAYKRAQSTPPPPDLTAVRSQVHVHPAFAKTAHSNFGSVTGEGNLASTGAQGAWFEFALYLGAGVWRVGYGSQTWDNRGRFHLSLDGVATGNPVDGMGSNGALTLGMSDPFTVATSGIKTVRVAMDSKNPASGAYYGVLAAVVFQPA